MSTPQEFEPLVGKPRTRLCWLCGRKFRGNHFTEVEIDGHMRELHKECAKKPDFWFGIEGISAERGKE